MRPVGIAILANRLMNKIISDHSFHCPDCGEQHEIALCFGAEFPDYYYAIPPEARASRVEMEKSLCVIDEEHFFIRGHLVIPILDYPEPFILSVWTTLSKDSFVEVNTLWNDPERTKAKPYFGWLQTEPTPFAPCLNIQTLVHTREVGAVPFVEVIEENHPLALDQTNGISIEKATELSRALLHPK
jgi:hypothetical protein